MRKALGAFALLIAAAVALPIQGETPRAAPNAEIKLWRFDCGDMPGIPLAMFSDTYAYGDAVMDMPVSCYLIKHGDRYMLWDTGFGTEYLRDHPKGLAEVRMRRSLVDQLKDIGIMPEQIAIVAISHNHPDHIGQAAYFPKAKLLIGAADLAALRQGQSLPGMERERIGPWLAPDSNAEGVTGDKDVFGDGTVVMLATPGHTEGHHSLLVRLAKMGPVLLSGDEYHFHAQMESRGVPPFNWNRAATLASHDRMEELVANLHATLIIQHDPGDVAKLPTPPHAAE